MKAAAKVKEEAPKPTSDDVRGVTLYVLSDEIMKLDEEIEVLGGDVSEGTPGEQLVERLAWVYELIKTKVDNVVRYVRNLETHRDGLKAEMERLSLMARYDDNKVKRLKAMALEVMANMGPDTKELKGELFKIARQKNGGETPIKLLEEDVAKWPERLTKWVPAIDMEAVRKELQAERDAYAAVPPGETPLARNPELAKLAEFGEVGHHIRFR